MWAERQAPGPPGGSEKTSQRRWRMYILKDKKELSKQGDPCRGHPCWGNDPYKSPEARESSLRSGKVSSRAEQRRQWRGCTVSRESPEDDGLPTLQTTLWLLTCLWSPVPSIGPGTRWACSNCWLDKPIQVEGRGHRCLKAKEENLQREWERTVRKPGKNQGD